MRKFISLLLVLVLASVLTLPQPSATYASESNSSSTPAITAQTGTAVMAGLAVLFSLKTLYDEFNASSRNVSGPPPGDTNDDSDQSEPPAQLPAHNIDGKLIVIDPGHGGRDPGAVGPTGLTEKEVALDISRKVAEMLRNNTRARVRMTREDDRDVSLYQRAAFANNLRADAFISIHSNAHTTSAARGIETFTRISATRAERSLAWYIQQEMIRELGLVDRGVKSANFYVLRATNMKSVLAEVGFISNHREEALLRDPAFRTRAARAIYNGILKYYASLG